MVDHAHAPSVRTERCPAAQAVAIATTAPARRAFGVVLVEPEIPMNTGAIGRLCVNVGATLDLVHPLGFEVSEKACRRAGLDYWPRLTVREHESWAAYQASASGAGASERWWALSAHATRSVFDADLRPGDRFVFGRESAGLSEAIMREAGPERLLAIPMRPGERSMNLSNAAAVVLFEAIRQSIVRGELATDERARLIEPV
jgi:tRNA (cytidine/uridine-2'-O-)-methyltransferase